MTPATMTRHAHAFIAGVWALVLAGACAGRELVDLGGDASQPGPGEAGGDGANGSFVVPGTLDCYQTICVQAEVCCEQYGVAPQCVAPGQCSDFTEACTATSCPDAAVCCVSAADDFDGGHITGSAACVQGAACPAGTQRACSDNVRCRSNEECVGFFAPRCVPIPGADAPVSD